MSISLPSVIPAVASLFLASAAIAEDQVASPFAGFQVGGNTNGAAQADTHALRSVALHAVLLMDNSTSMKSAELMRARDGLFNYLLSDQALLDYSAGMPKAVTIGYFAEDQIISPTYLVSSPSDAQKVIDEFLIRVGFERFSGDLAFNPGQTLKNGTNVVEAINATAEIFAGEAALGIVSERREVVFLGDELFASQQMDARKASDRLTKEYGARLCPIAVHDSGTEAPRYDYIVTNRAQEIFNASGYPYRVQPCKVLYAEQPKDVQTAIMQTLALARP